MSAGVLLAVLLGAFLHASWNVLVKAGHDTRVAAAGVYIGAGVLSAIALPFLPPPSAASWPYLAASTVVEVLYGLLLAAAYRLGDLSHAYPLMRGTAPLLVAIGSGVLIGESLSGAVYAAVALGGACSVGSYTLALWAMTRAPVAAVAAVRETSIVFGAALGAIVLRERVTRVRALAAVAIAFGVWIIRAY